MWIRTECGKLIKTNLTNNYIGAEYTNYLGVIIGTIKKQGNNLIDVLEDYDQLVRTLNGVVITSMSVKRFKYYYKVVIEKNGFENTMKRYKYEVITHEQYMPLAQTIEREDL